MKINTNYFISHKAKLSLIAALLCSFVINTHCQNYGLKEPQDPVTLPKSKAKIIMPERKEKIREQTVLVPQDNYSYQLVNGWELIEESKLSERPQSISSTMGTSDQWYNATVPGTVLTTLVNQGIYPDPYFGINNLSIPDSLCRQNWWYRIEFNLPDDYSNKNVWLNFEGINYAAEIWMNGDSLGRLDGAFIRGSFDVSKFLVIEKTNVLAVRILPPPNPGIPHEESPLAGTGPNGGQLCLDGPTFISSEGWDWIPGIRDRNIGIWQDVSLKFTGLVTISDPQVKLNL